VTKEKTKPNLIIYISIMTLFSVLTSNFSYIVDLLSKAIFPTLISLVIFPFIHKYLFNVYNSLGSLKLEKLSNGLFYSSITGATLMTLLSAFNFYNAKTSYDLIEGSQALTFAFFFNGGYLFDLCYYIGIN